MGEAVNGGIGPIYSQATRNHLKREVNDEMW
ncbi:hypothetical protein HNQ08_002889 [Deinococcus humi]|uniref:Uncharacterized protein n=1 Tax=Deinococcus humi TaxID=662880 RepID=A0A7W8NHA1_9DEIO|nr:hypothetical protein [Deinococcus humi]